jgi:hypothetical protein
MSKIKNKSKFIEIIFELNFIYWFILLRKFDDIFLLLNYIRIAFFWNLRRCLLVLYAISHIYRIGLRFGFRITFLPALLPLVSLSFTFCLFISLICSYFPLLFEFSYAFLNFFSIFSSTMHHLFRLLIMDRTTSPMEYFSSSSPET